MDTVTEEELGQRLRAHRIAAGIDQRDLAERAGIGVSALRRLENGNGSTLTTLIAVTSGLNVPLNVPAADPTTTTRRAPRPTTRRPRLERREERVSLELHRAIVNKLRRHPDRVRGIARKNVDGLRRTVRGPLANDWIDTWEAALDGPTAALVALCLREDESGVDLRQVSPFNGVLDQGERLAAINKARSW